MLAAIGVTSSGNSYTITATLTAPNPQLSDLEIHLRTSSAVDIQDTSGNRFDVTQRDLTTGDTHYILNTTPPDADVCFLKSW